MKARDERVSLMNEVSATLFSVYTKLTHVIPGQILGGIRMLKFMAWERSFEARVLKVRDRELKYQKLNYTIEVRELDDVSVPDSKQRPPGFVERYLVSLTF